MSDFHPAALVVPWIHRVDSSAFPYTKHGNIYPSVFGMQLISRSNPPRRPHDIRKMQGWTKVPPCPLFWEFPPPKRPHDIHKMQGWTKVPRCPLFFGNPHPWTWAATYTEPITFEFCTQHYIISLGNPPQFKPIAITAWNCKDYWNKSKFAYVELIRKKN
jgi:hypothetical protein